jgi:tRNA1Val (adenine37-N6)-methyltransferase
MLKSNSFEVKKIQFVYPRVDKPSTLCLIEAVKNAKSGVKILEPIIIFGNDGSYTEKIQRIYGK